MSKDTDFDRLQSLRFKRPFTNWRPGQKTALKQLHDGHDRTSKGKPILFEAPTGFGKTGVSLQFALEKIKDGTYEKLFCLTGKSTGQNAFLKQLSLMQANCSPRYFQLRSREEHNIRSQTHTCDGRNCRKDLEENGQTLDWMERYFFLKVHPLLNKSENSVLKLVFVLTKFLDP